MTNALETAYEAARTTWEKDGSRVPLNDGRLTDRAWEAAKNEFPLWLNYRQALDNLKHY